MSKTVAELIAEAQAASKAAIKAKGIELIGYRDLVKK